MSDNPEQPTSDTQPVNVPKQEPNRHFHQVDPEYLPVTKQFVKAMGLDNMIPEWQTEDVLESLLTMLKSRQII